MKKNEKDIFKQVDEISSDMERLFYHLFCPKSPVKSLADKHWRPMTDIYETTDSIIIKMDLAGVKKEDLSIVLDRDSLIIKGIRKETLPEDVQTFYQMEINYGYFERILLLKPGTRKLNIDARFKDGFLTITISKEEAEKEKVIEVKVE